MLTLLAFLLTLSPPDSKLSIVFEDMRAEVASDEAAPDVRYELRRDGALYGDGKNAVAAIDVWIVRMLAAAETLPDSTIADSTIDDLGITVEQCAEHRDEILRCLHPPGHPRHGLVELPEHLQRLTTPAALLKHIEQYLLPDASEDGGFVAGLETTLRIYLDGDPVLELAGSVDRPWGMPWLVEYGPWDKSPRKTKHRSLSLPLSRAIAAILPADPRLSRIDATQYLRDEVWSDPAAWQGLRAEFDAAFDILIQDEEGGCFHFEEGHCSYLRSDDFFVGPRGSLEVDFVRLLRQRALNQPYTARDGLAQLGVNAAAATTLLPHLVAAVVPEGKSVGDLPARSQAALTVERILDIAAKHLRPSESWSSSWRRLSVSLPGDPPVVLACDRFAPLLLPWTVTAGDREWLTYDPWISRQLAKIVTVDGPAHSALTHEEYFQLPTTPPRRKSQDDDSPFHFDEDEDEDEGDDEVSWTIWSDIHEALESILANEDLRVAIEATVSADWARHFVVADVSGGARSRDCEFTAQQAATIDAVRLRWQRQTPPAWSELLDLYRDGERQAMLFAWLEDWRAAGDERSVRLEKRNDEKLGAGWQMGRLIWEAQGLEEQGAFALALVEDGQMVYEVVLSERDGVAVVVTSRREAKRKHWIDRAILADDVDDALLLSIDGEILPLITDAEAADGQDGEAGGIDGFDF